MASDYLLELEGIKGESSDKKYKDTIEIESFSWAPPTPAATRAAAAAAPGRSPSRTSTSPSP
jgi:type VI secretion system secreted protein Hcp